MSLTEAERIIILWNKVYTQEGPSGAEVLEMFPPAMPAPGTLTWSQLCTSMHRGFQAGVRQGQQGHQQANMACVLFELRELHAYILQVDPINIERLSHCLLVMVTLCFPEIFRATAHTAWDNFLSIMSCVLTEK
ncbi:hemoglobin subunit zeta-like [Eumetopias jubatus]|uniref:hemoglobin subunit zeta-like n=1 Tax=Eumetopias jubatus TaxID=34886 RepID=UPI00101676CC|nr:hemoglobin subunit zeta-like [Eumetopias jubatus]